MAILGILQNTQLGNEQLVHSLNRPASCSRYYSMPGTITSTTGEGMTI